MVKVKALENFTFARYKEIEKTLNSKAKKEQGRLFEGDIFECNKEMADYLLGDNPINRAVVKVIEVIPEKQIEKKVKKDVEKVANKKPRKLNKSLEKK